MRSFTDYLYHTQKIYEFRIKLADVELSDDTLTRIRNALNAYGVENLSKPKRLPIQTHADFPKLGPCECHYIDFTVKYPTTSDQLTHIVAERALLDKGRVCVKTKDSDELITSAENLGKDRADPVLTDPVLKDEKDAQSLVGQARVSGFIKELAKNKVSKFEVAGKEKADGTTTDSLPQGKVSPVGSKQNKIPSAVKGK
jgi:hypothetical protein